LSWDEWRVRYKFEGGLEWIYNYEDAI
jgi:hypothetical protein